MELDSNYESTTAGAAGSAVIGGSEGEGNGNADARGGAAGGGGGSGGGGDSHVLGSQIRSFSSAIAAVKQHTFRDVTDFESAANLASDLYTRTHEVINTSDLNNLQTVHSTLNATDNFLAYILTLHASLANIQHDSPLLPTLFQNLTTLVNNTDSKWVRAVPQPWIGSFRHAVRLVIDNSQHRRQQSVGLSLVAVLLKACQRLAKEDDELVPLHADYLALCIHTKYYRHAVHWIRQCRRLHIDPRITKLEASDVHLIYHYSTWILTAIKDYTSAFQTCRLALVVPAPSPGSFFTIALQTYKLYLLLHVLSHSATTLSSSNSKHPHIYKGIGMPSSSSSSSGSMVSTSCIPQLKNSSYQTGTFRKLTSEYIELLLAFDKNDGRLMRQLIESNKEIYIRNEMMGLVKQVMNALHRKLILKLSKSYITLTLKQVADKVGLRNEQDVENLILKMIKDKIFIARIDQRSKIVTLMEEQHSIQRDNGLVTTQYMNHCLDVVIRLQRFREGVECDPEYIRRDLASQTGRGKQSSTAARAFASSSSGFGVAEIEAEFMR